MELELPTEFCVRLYSLRPKLSTKSYFMKQKCQLQMDIVKYNNAVTPLTLEAQIPYISTFK